jgi:hypothetical protein
VELFRSPANYLSFWGPDSLSVVQREITKLTIPALLMRADGDDFTPDAMSQNVLTAGLDAGVDITYTVLDYPFPLGDFGGNAHGFVAVEREMIANTFDWLTSHVPEATEYTYLIKAPREQPDGNFTPLADAGDNLTTAAGGPPVVLDASRSVDIDGEVVSYRWRQVWGQHVALDDSASPHPSFVSGNRAQNLYFLLRVTDDSGAIDWDFVRVEITGGQCERPDRHAPWSAWRSYWRCHYSGWW